MKKAAKLKKIKKETKNNPMASYLYGYGINDIELVFDSILLSFQKHMCKNTNRNIISGLV
jgi:hypothetical protein